MMVPQKPYKKKVMLSTIPINEKKEKLYAKIYYSIKNIADTNHALFQIPKEELAEIFWSKKEMIRMKITILESKKRAKYALSNSYIKVD